MNIHAPDAMGEAAHDAAMLATKLPERLLVAASANASRKDRADALRKALEQFSYLAGSMAELELTAPNIAAQARDLVGRTQDFREASRDHALTNRRGDEGKQDD